MSMLQSIKRLFSRQKDDPQPVTRKPTWQLVEDAVGERDRQREAVRRARHTAS